MNLFILCLLAGSFPAVRSSDSALDYGNQAAWDGDCNNGGKAQSPVNVVVSDTIKDQGTLIKFTDADSLSATNENDLNAIKIAFQGDALTYKIPGLTDITGTVVQFHLHWGSSAGNGSEHTLNGKRYSAEAHLVTSYTDEAGDGKLAVIGRFFEEGQENTQIGKIITSQKATSTSDRTISNFNLTALYPSTIDSVVTYSGSLTTPACTEIVHWIVVPEALTISTAQLEALRTVALGEGDQDAKTYNWRELQDTNDRKFTCYKMNGAPSHLTSSLILTLAAALSSLLLF